MQDVVYKLHIIRRKITIVTIYFYNDYFIVYIGYQIFASSIYYLI